MSSYWEELESYDVSDMLQLQKRNRNSAFSQSFVMNRSWRPKWGG